MEFDRFKSAWQTQPARSNLSLSPHGMSQSLQWLRTSTIRDLERSDELSRLIFSFLFALVFVGASFAIMPMGTARVIAWLFAAALLVDGIGGVVLRLRRRKEPASSTILEFITAEEHRTESRMKLEQYSQRVLLVLAAFAILLLVFGPPSSNTREDVLRMGTATAFLAVAWFRAKSGSRFKEIRHELQGYLKDLQA